MYFYAVLLNLCFFFFLEHKTNVVLLLDTALVILPTYSWKFKLDLSAVSTWFQLCDHLDSLQIRNYQMKHVLTVPIICHNVLQDILWQCHLCAGIHSILPNLCAYLQEKVTEGGVGPSSSRVCPTNLPNDHPERQLTSPTTEDGEYLEYSFDSLSEIPCTVEDEQRVGWICRGKSLPE